MVFAIPILAIPFLGLAVGSFLNVVIHRVPRHESIVKPGSHCPECACPVRNRDNVPVLSWLALRGRCRDCRFPISRRYPLVEIATAAAFGLVAVLHGVDRGLLLELPLVAVLIAVAAIDLDHRIVPNRILAPAAAWALVGLALIEPAALPAHLAAGAGAFLFLLTVALIYPGGMGMGDVKLTGMLGLYLGMSVVVALLVAVLAGSLVGIALIVRRGAVARKAAIPFAPFLALGGFVGLLWGAGLIELYADRFL